MSINGSASSAKFNREFASVVISKSENEFDPNGYVEPEVEINTKEAVNV